MISKSILVLCLPPLAPVLPDLPTNKYAESIPYEELYQIESTPNKNTMEYNTTTTEELVRIQNRKILNELFIKELQNQPELDK